MDKKEDFYMDSPLPPLSPPDVTTTVHTIKSGDNVPEWGNGDCVWCNCEDAFEVVTTITETVTKSEISQTHSLDFTPLVQDAITTKDKFNLIYIMDDSSSRSALFSKAFKTLLEWAESVKGSGINFYFENYSGGLANRKELRDLNTFEIPGSPLDMTSAFKEPVKSNIFSTEERFGHLIKTMAEKFPGATNLFVFESDYADWALAQATATSLEDSGKRSAKNLVSSSAREVMKKYNVKFLALSEYFWGASSTKITSVAPDVYELSLWEGGKRFGDIVDRGAIIEAFSKEVVTRPASTGKTTISLSDPSQGVDVVEAYVTAPGGERYDLQLTAGKYVGDFNPRVSGLHKLHFTFRGKPLNKGIFYATLNGKTTEYPYEASVKRETKIDTHRSSCEAMKEMNTKKLRDFAILFRDLETCNLAEEGAKGFYNVWCMFNNVIDQLCYLQERIDGHSE